MSLLRRIAGFFWPLWPSPSKPPCEHPNLRVTAVLYKAAPHARTEPRSWRCGDCGKEFRRDEWCPNCAPHLSNRPPMDICGYRGFFPSYFHCPRCGKYFTREELHK